MHVKHTWKITRAQVGYILSHSTMHKTNHAPNYTQTQWYFFYFTATPKVIRQALGSNTTDAQTWPANQRHASHLQVDT